MHWHYRSFATEISVSCSLKTVIASSSTTCQHGMKSQYFRKMCVFVGGGAERGWHVCVGCWEEKETEHTHTHTHTHTVSPWLSAWLTIFST